MASIVSAEGKLCCWSWECFYSRSSLVGSMKQEAAAISNNDSIKDLREGSGYLRRIVWRGDEERAAVQPEKHLLCGGLAVVAIEEPLRCCGTSHHVKHASANSMPALRYHSSLQFICSITQNHSSKRFVPTHTDTHTKTVGGFLPMYKLQLH